MEATITHGYVALGRFASVQTYFYPLLTAFNFCNRKKFKYILSNMSEYGETVQYIQEQLYTLWCCEIKWSFIEIMGEQNIIMHVISVKIPEELKEEIKELMKEEGLEEGIALRKLLTMAISEWKKERALKMLTEGKMTYLKAAGEAGMNVWDFAELLKEKKVVWVKEEGILRDLNARF